MKTIILTLAIDPETGEATPTITNRFDDPAELDRALDLLAQSCLQLAQSYMRRRVELAKQIPAEEEE